MADALLSHRDSLWVGCVPRDLTEALGKRIRRKGGKIRFFAQPDGTYFAVADVRFRLGREETSPWAEEVDGLTATEQTLDAIDRIPDYRADWLRNRKLVHGSRAWALPNMQGDFFAIESDPFEEEGGFTDLLAELGLENVFFGPDEIPGLDGMDTARAPWARSPRDDDDGGDAGGDDDAFGYEALDWICNFYDWAWDVAYDLAEPHQARFDRPPPAVFACVARARSERRLRLRAKLERHRERLAEREQRRKEREARERRAEMGRFRLWECTGGAVAG
jgi:hypothetical protein